MTTITRQYVDEPLAYLAVKNSDIAEYISPNAASLIVSHYHHRDLDDVREHLLKKRMFSFGLCPNYLPPFRASCTSFLGSMAIHLGMHSLLLSFFPLADVQLFSLFSKSLLKKGWDVFLFLIAPVSPGTNTWIHNWKLKGGSPSSSSLALDIPSIQLFCSVNTAL